MSEPWHLYHFFHFLLERNAKSILANAISEDKAKKEGKGKLRRQDPSSPTPKQRYLRKIPRPNQLYQVNIEVIMAIL